MRILVSTSPTPFHADINTTILAPKVGVLWVLDTAQLVLIVQSLYNYAVLWRGDVEALGDVSKWVPVLPLF